jgi:3-oxoacyl-[acyl-carrier-protein] synthase II
MGRVAITGIGLCTPVGVGTDETWAGLVEGRSGIGPIEAYDASSLQTRLGAEVKELVPKEYVKNRRSIRTMTRHDVVAMAAAAMAVRDSGLELEDDPEGRNALFTAGNKQVSDPDYFSDASVQARDGNGVADVRRFGELAYGSVHPLFFIEGIQGASLFYISEAYGVRGPNTYFAGTAEAGLFAIGRGYRAVKRGEAEVALVGAGDAPIFWWHMAAWDTSGMTTRRNDLGPAACAPYDVDRDGTVLGEGGAFLLLEDLEAAQARGAKVYAEITGWGAAADTQRMMTPDPTGRPVAAAVERTLRSAELAAGDVDFVAAEGSGTVLGDASEAAGLRSAFGSDGLVASSVKGATGHLMGAAGALNAAVAALAIDRGAVPPTLNLKNADPACAGVDWVAGEAREQQVRTALALARGIEGQNVALALRAV